MEHLKEFLIEQPRVRVGSAGQFATGSHTLAVWVGGASRVAWAGGRDMCCFPMTGTDLTRLNTWLTAHRYGTVFEPTPDMTPKRPFWWLPEGVDVAGGSNVAILAKRDGAGWRLHLDKGEVALYAFIFQREWVVRARFQSLLLKRAVRKYLDPVPELTKT